MKKILIALMLLTPALTCAAKPAPNPADYTITVHVLSSHVVGLNIGSSDRYIWRQHLTVLIDGKKFELDGESSDLELLRLGDYKAKILKDESKRAYEYQRIYEFLFPDGATRDYYVASEPE